MSLIKILEKEKIINSQIIYKGKKIEITGMVVKMMDQMRY